MQARDSTCEGDLDRDRDRDQAYRDVLAWHQRREMHDIMIQHVPVYSVQNITRSQSVKTITIWQVDTWYVKQKITEKVEV